LRFQNRQRAGGKNFCRIQPRQEANDLRAGWAWALDSLKSHLENGKRVSYAEWEAAQK